MIIQVVLDSFEPASLAIARLSHYLGTMTPMQKLHAAARLTTQYSAQRYFTLLGLVLIATLSTLLVFVTVIKWKYDRKGKQTAFRNLARKTGLNNNEQRLLRRLASIGKIKTPEILFTNLPLYDRAAARMIERNLKWQKSDEQMRAIKLELAFLKEKLGFRKQFTISALSQMKSKKPGSGQLPLNKTVHLTNSRIHPHGIDGIVTENDDFGITIKLESPIKTKKSEKWSIRYYYGANIWEFETTCSDCTEDAITFNHTNHVKLVNRRRFIRVPVRKQAYIAAFDFEKPFDLNKLSGQKRYLPDFSSAVLTEIGGPGLKFETDSEIRNGQRILISFSLNDLRNYANNRLGTEFAHSKQRIIQDIAVVRNITETDSGKSIAVELIGLSDSDIDGLIKATNAELINNAKSKKLSKDYESQRLVNSFIRS